jgi:cell division protein YceG involved in septum cleavage
MNRTSQILTEGQSYYQLNKRRVWVVGAIVLILFLMFSVGFITKTVTAQRSAARTKTVTSVEIKKGDTLWSIASEYYSDEYDDMNEYIEEIMYSNGMSSDVIQAGNFIIVPYYKDAVD